jgi:hypothetical protein
MLNDKNKEYDTLSRESDANKRTLKDVQVELDTLKDTA